MLMLAIRAKKPPAMGVMCSNTDEYDIAKHAHWIQHDF